MGCSNSKETNWHVNTLEDKPRRLSTCSTSSFDSITADRSSSSRKTPSGMNSPGFIHQQSVEIQAAKPVEGTSSGTTTPVSTSGKKLTLLQSRSLEKSLSIQTTSDGCDGTFSNPVTPSLDPNIQVVVPDDFRKKYKVISILSEKNIASFAFKGHIFRSEDADANQNDSVSEIEDGNRDDSSSVVLYKGVDRQRKYVIVERTRVDLYQESTIQIEYFERIDLLRRIDHVCIPCVLDVFDTPRDYTIVLQYGVGKSVHELMEARGAINNKEAIKALVLSLASTLQHLHDMNVAHRNIDTNHLILSRFNHFKQKADLRIVGLGRITNIPTKAAAFTVSAVPQSYLNVFSAPELSKPDHDLKVDLYSLGVVIYSLLNGHTPLKKSDMRIDALPVASRLKRVIYSLVDDDPSRRCSLRRVKSYFTKAFVNDDDSDIHALRRENSHSSSDGTVESTPSLISQSSVNSVMSDGNERKSGDFLMKLATYSLAQDDDKD